MSHRIRIAIPVMIAVYAAALLSGTAALIYEVVWSRMLVIPLGNSADATAMVLAAFMFGIAIGALLLGRIADRIRAPLRLYAILEIALGAYALLVPFLISLLGELDLFQGSFDERPFSAVGRLCAAGALVALPSLVMGATLPILTRALARSAKEVRLRIGLIYGANTIGASVGAAVAGFLAIPLLGVTVTSTLAAGGSFAAALIVIVVRRLAGDLPPVKEDVARVSLAATPVSGRFIGICALLVAGASGLTMLGAEVLWARLLTFVFGHDTYAFAVLLAVVLAGLGIGGFVHRKLSVLDPLALVGVLVGLLSLTLLVSYWAASWLIITFGRDPFQLGAMGTLTSSIRLEFYREIVYTPILVMLPSIVAGAAFPAACTLYTGTIEKAGSRVGTATLVNGLGSAAGSLVTSFLLITVLGIQGALLLISGLAILVSLIVAATARRPVLAIPALVASALTLIIPTAQPRAMLAEAVGRGHQDVLYYEEGRTGTVSVTRNTVNQEKQLFMNAVNEVTTRLVHDQSFKLLGHLGPLLHPRPKDGAMVCLGAGLSAGAALVHPLAKLDVVELSSAMPRAAALWREENNDVLKDPRLKLHVADGRHFLKSTKSDYDVIMVDSTHPKAVDSWILYTREFYELMRQRLRQNGLVVQWVPLHGLSEREFKIIVRTFIEVFPEATLWVNVGYETYGQAAYVKMVASLEPLLIDYRELALRLGEPRIEGDLTPFGMARPEELLDCFLAGPRAIARWTDGLPVQTDNHPIVPFTTGFSAGRRMAAPLLLGVRSSVLPLLRGMGSDEATIRETLGRANEAQGFLLAGLLERARETWPDSQKIALFKESAARGRDYYVALAKKYPGDSEKLFEIGSYLGNLGFPADARELYEAAKQITPADSRISINLGLILLDLGEIEQAIDLIEQVVSREPDNPLARYNLGVALLAAENAGDATSHLTQSIALAPDLVGPRLALARALLDRGQLDRAEVELEAVVAQNRWIAEAWDNLGLIAFRRGDADLAQKHHIRALSLEPYRAASHYNLGIVLQETGRLQEAAAAYQAALRIEPRDAEALNNLGLVYAAAGLAEKAADAHRSALDVEPHYPQAAYNLGLDYRALGQDMAAAEAFGLALTLDPGLTPARKQIEALGLDRVTVEGAPRDADAGAQ